MLGDAPLEHHGEAPTPAAVERDGVDRIQEAWLRERPGTPVGSIGVITRVWRVARLLRDERARTMQRLDVDTATRDLLSTLRRAGPPYRMSAGEIAAASLVTRGAVSQRVARAEAQGLVRRARADGDRRRVVVELTPEGHALVERTVDELLRHEDDLLSSLDEGQRAQLADLLRIVLADLTRRADVGP